MPGAAAPASGFHLLETTIGEVRTALASGQITCHALVDAYLKRIVAYDKSGPALNAVQTVMRSRKPIGWMPP
jgi:Asp-tRNA(Asn)/Glu-tRNA(Gln) amidotransferase A subunit family amidase